MNDEILNIIEVGEGRILNDERIVEAPRPKVPIRQILQFKISDERNNS